MALTTPNPAEQDPSHTELFMRLFIAHERRLRAFILTLAPNWSDAEDILQETSAVLWRKFDQFMPGTNFAAWALSIARYQVMDYRKRRMVRSAHFSQRMLDTLADQLITRQPEMDARHEALHHCLSKLEGKQRQLIRWRYEEGATTHTVAARINRTIDAVYKSLNKIHAALLECVRKQMAAEGHRGHES